MKPVLKLPRAAASRCLVAILLLVILGGAFVASAAVSRPPNIVVIFADDMGYADCGPFGAKDIATPNLDRMAREGIRLTSFYVAQPVCSASRTALLTGCYPNRVGIAGALGPASKVGISASEQTIADVLKTRSYATAIFGKWHLGHHPQFLPTRHGFDEYFGLPYSNDMWPFHPGAKKGTYPNLPLFDNESVVNANVTSDDQTQLTTQYAGRAVKFIEQNKARPFFLYVPHAMPHVPLHVSDKFKGKSGRGLYGDVIMEIDWAVGEILGALKRSGIDEQTLVIFTSDNGPWLSYGNHGGSAGPLREGKGTVWEGGVREPFLARWPGKIPAGTVCHEPAMTIDLLPTFAKLAGAAPPKNKIDGLDIWPLLAGDPKAKCPHEAFFFYYKLNELHAVRSGKWKLYLPHGYNALEGGPGGLDGKPVPYLPRKVTEHELYDLASDLGEKTNVAGKNPDVVKRLEALAEQSREELGDTLTNRKGNGVREVGRLVEAK